MAALRTRTRSFTRWDWAFVASSVVMFVVLMFLARGATFWHDDWKFLVPDRLGWSLSAFMVPHNEHWVAIPALIWKVLVATVGLGSYLPYLAALAVAHLAAASAFYWYARRKVDGPWALVLGAAYLVINTADFQWATTLGFVLSVAFGGWALVLSLEAPERSRVAVALLLIAAVASSGPGLFYVAAIAVVLLLVPHERRRAWVVLPAAAAYLIWLLSYGVASGQTLRAIAANPQILADYVTSGVGYAVGSTLGLGATVGLIVAVVGMMALAVHLTGRSALMSGAVAGVAGLLAGYVITGLARAPLGADQAQSARYLYPAIFFVLVAVVAWLADRLPLLSVRASGALAVLVAWSVFSHAAVLSHSAKYYVQRGFETRAAIESMLSYGGSPALPDATPQADAANEFLSDMPGPGRMKALVAAYGNPLHDPWLASAGPVPAEVSEQILMMIVGSSLQTTAVDAMPPSVSPPIVVDISGAAQMLDQGCVAVQPSQPDARVQVELWPSQDLYIETSTGGSAGLRLSRTPGLQGAGSPTTTAFRDDPTRTLHIEAGRPLRIVLPDLGDLGSWYATVTLTSQLATVLCAG